MRTGKWVLHFGLAGLLSACQQVGSAIAPAARVDGFEPPRFGVLQLTEPYRFASEEEAILAGINGYRAAHGLAALSESAELRAFSRAYATDMATRNYFSHTNPEGKGPYLRLVAAGIGFAYYGATNSFASIDANAVIADWDMHSGKKYMLDPRFTEVGVGVAGPAANGRYRVTATYIRPRIVPASGTP